MESKTRQNSKFRLVLWVMLLFATLTASAQQVNRGKLLLVHRAVTNDHDLVEHVVLLLERHVDGLAAVHLLHDGLEAHIRERDGA